MRKGQMLGQIVIYVLGLIVVSAVFYFGYTVIEGLGEKQCELRRAQFGSELKTLLEANRAWGTSKIVQLETPCETIAVCFIDREFIDSNPTSGPSGISDERITRSVTSRDPTNVFTVQQNNQPIPVERYTAISAPVAIHGADGLCINANQGILEMRLVGTGQTVQVHEQ